ncbi:MAG: hypothetical protein CME82_10415 [Halomonas sp.]|nr:hypothetical protein [Halomonas sp.]
MYRHRLVIPVQWLIGIVIVGVMVVMAVALLGFSWHQSQRTLGATLEETSAQLVDTLEARTQALVRPAQVAINMLANGAPGEADDWAGRLAALPLMSSALEAHRLIDAVYIGYGSGDFLMFRAVDRMLESKRPGIVDKAGQDAAYLALVVDAGPGQSPLSEWHLFDRSLAPLGRERLDQYFFDPRTRPWFQQAPEGDAPFLTAPYVFFNTGEIGISMARRSGDAVVGLDVASRDLGVGLDDLRLTPQTRMAVVTASGQALATTLDGSLNSGLDSAHRLSSLEDLAMPVLAQLLTTNVDQPPRRLSHEGRHWWGLVLPFATLGGEATRLMAAVPEDELTTDVRQMMLESSLLAGIVTLALLPLGVLLGRRLGRPLRELSGQVEALGRYDFSACDGVGSRVTEVRGLSVALRRLARGIEGFGRITRVLNSEPRLDRMLTSILEDLLRGTGSRAGAIYLADEQDEGRFARIAREGEARDPDADPRERELRLQQGSEAELEALIERFEAAGYLLQPLRNREGATLGLLALALRSLDDGDAHWRAFVAEVSSAAAVAIDLRRLLRGEARLLEGIVQLVAHAIDAKSPHTGSHCSRVPVLAEMIVDGIDRSEHGVYAETHFDETRRGAFHLAAWLHDCGKLAIPDEVMEKATKLEARYDRIHEIRTRFEVLWRDADVAYWQGRAHGGDPVILERRRHARQQELVAAFECVAEANRGGEAISDDLLERLTAIAQWRWWRHFDDRLGVSRDELKRMSREPLRRLPAEECLLADLPRHEIPWHRSRPAVAPDDPDNIWCFDMRPSELAGHQGELFNLRVSRGTLNEVERFRIQEHVIQTIMMLEALPWPAHLRRVPDIAGNHHERMDGTGYPRRLAMKDASLEERVMVMADVFEALTAADRPYKSAMTLSRALTTLADMVREGHLDPAIFRLMLEQRIYSDYAERFLTPAQRDSVDIEALLARAGA